eukprot:6456099-Amphidinium_carterae.1
MKQVPARGAKPLFNVTLANLCVAPRSLFFTSMSMISHHQHYHHGEFQVRKGIVDHLDLFLEMYNGLAHARVTHFCWKEGNRCCSNSDEVVAKMVLATEHVLLPYLFSCTSDPTAVKWWSFSGVAAPVARVMGMGLLCHNLLRTAWERSFKAAQQEDLPADELEDDVTERQLMRIRKLKVHKFFQNDVTESLFAVLGGIQCIEQLQMNVCCWDAARKTLAAQKHKERRAQTTSPSLQAQEAISARSCSLLDDLMGGDAIGPREVCICTHGYFALHESCRAIYANLRKLLSRLKTGQSPRDYCCQQTGNKCRVAYARHTRYMMVSQWKVGNRTSQKWNFKFQPGKKSLNVYTLVTSAVETLILKESFGVQREEQQPNANLETLDIGLLAKFADGSPDSLRGRLHASCSSLLHPGSLLECLQCTRLVRAIVLQQDSEFYMRFDLYYGAFPAKWLALRLNDTDKASLIHEARMLETCCVDEHFTSKLLSFDDDKILGVQFQHALASMDLDDQSVSIIETERQHGRLRRGYGKQLQKLRRSLAKAYLAEWSLEHKDLGFAMQQGPPKERLRALLRAHKAKKVRVKPGGNPQQRFVSAMDSSSDRDHPPLKLESPEPLEYLKF